MPTDRRSRRDGPHHQVGLALRGVERRVLPTQASRGPCDDRAMPTTVLLVDDDPHFRALARRMLTAAGLAVVGEAATVAAATAAALELRPDTALVDVGLPDGNGIALAGELTALHWRPRVLLTSTDPDAASPEDVRLSGANSFVPKADLPNAPLERLFAIE